VTDVAAREVERAALQSPASPRPAQHGQGPVSRALTWLALLSTILVGFALLAQVPVFLRHAQVLVSYRYDLDQGEGYDVWAAWQFWQGQPLYTSNEHWPYFSTNYPPVYFALLGPLLGWLGLAIGVGRALAATATLLCALVIALAARAFARDALAAAFAGLLFLASTYVFHVGALARVNPLMCLLAVAGIACLARPSGWRLPLGLALLVCAVFTKQTALDALLAAVVFLALRDWRLAGRALLGCALVGVLGVGLLQWSSDGAFLLNTVTGNANPWDGWQALDYMRNFVGLHLVVLVGAVLGLRLRRDTRPSIYAPFLAVSAIAALGAGKWGAGESYFLETLAAACIASAPAIGYGLHHRAPLLRLLTCAALALQLILGAHGPTVQRLFGLPDRGFQAATLGGQPTHMDTRAADMLVREYVLKWDGPLLAEESGFLVAAGKPVVGNATQLRNLHAANAWDPAPLVHDLERHRFDFVILNGQLYPPPVLEAIGRHYYLHATVRINGYNYLVFAPGAD
jgi:hypothetical protein